MKKRTFRIFTKISQTKETNFNNILLLSLLSFQELKIKALICLMNRQRIRAYFYSLKCKPSGKYSLKESQRLNFLQAS